MGSLGCPGPNFRERILTNRPFMAAMLRHPQAPLEVAGHDFDIKDYALALTHQSPLRIQLDLALLDLEEAGFFADLDRRWLGRAAAVDWGRETFGAPVSMAGVGSPR